VAYVHLNPVDHPRVCQHVKHGLRLQRSHLQGRLCTVGRCNRCNRCIIMYMCRVFTTHTSVDA
jgi:hypothetical protein